MFQTVSMGHISRLLDGQLIISIPWSLIKVASAFRAMVKCVILMKEILFSWGHGASTLEFYIVY